MRHRLMGAGLALVGALVTWSCSGGGSGSTPTTPTSPTTPAGPTVTVSIVSSTGNTAFRPNPVSARSGDVVRFANNDSTVHHIVMDDGSADLGLVAPGSASSGMTVQSTNPATFHCVLHPSMVGSLNGQTAPEPPACADPTGYNC